MGRLVLVSNRVADAGQAAQAGGVAVALAENLRKHGGLWLGWDGHVAAEPAAAADIVRQDDRMAIATVPITKSEHQGYYLGYSNSVLWPVFHNRLDLAQFEAGYFKEYLEVNRRMARLLQPLLLPDDIIWVHDYHLIPFAAELRQLGIQNPIGFFLHIPFAPAQAFLAIPEHRELARAFSAYDFIGFQTTVDVAHFFDSVRQGVSGQILQDGRIKIFDRAISVGSIPVSIDVTEFSGGSWSHARPAPTKVQRLLGIDRLDYTKGLPQKFRSFGRFLEKYPVYRNKVVLSQIAPPTRESVEAYSDIRKELESLSGSINGTYGDLDWVPIQYIHRARPRLSLRSVYRSSKVALVTPLRDGMNLVAKEFVAAQDPAGPGVLILSRFAGAAEELDAALIVNPYNTEEVADAIDQALRMSLEERISRHQAALERIVRHDTFAWCRDFLNALNNAVNRDASPSSGRAGALQDRLQQLERVLSRPEQDATAKLDPVGRTARRAVAGQGGIAVPR